MEYTEEQIKRVKELKITEDKDLHGIIESLGNEMDTGGASKMEMQAVNKELENVLPVLNWKLALAEKAIKRYNLEIGDNINEISDFIEG